MLVSYIFVVNTRLSCMVVKPWQTAQSVVLISVTQIKYDASEFHVKSSQVF